MASPALPLPPQTHYINGLPHHSNTTTFFTHDPSTGAIIAQVHAATQSDINLAITTSQAAFQLWSKTSAIERSRILLRAVSLLRARNDEIAAFETLDTGKPLCETMSVDVASGADVLEYFAGVGMAAGTGKMIQLRESAWVYTRKEPLGVCVGIGAWNYPIQIALWKCAPALAAGNTFIFKPSEVTPLTALVLASLFTTAGLPPGVFNVLQGDGSVGAALSSDPRIAKISFTGQTSTGTSVYTSAAKTLKHVTLELGGKSPLIVFPDANLSAAVDACLTANFFSSGQVCTAGSRVFVHRDIRAAFQELLVARVLDCVRPGNPMALETNFGPLVSETQRRRVETYIRHGSETDHATLLLGGLGSPPELPPGGYYVRPTVFTDCTDDMRIVREEIFGPVACLLEFTSEEEVVRRANGLEYGLAAGVFTRDLDTAHRVVAGVRAGIFWVNTWGESPAQMPVGGWGCSGLGVENGEEALGLFARNKSVLVESGDAPVAFAKL